MLGLLKDACRRLAGRSLRVHFWGGLFQEKTASALELFCFLAWAKLPIGIERSRANRQGWRSFTFLEVVCPNGGQFFLQFFSKGFDGAFVGFGVGQVVELFGVLLHVEEFDSIPAMFKATFQLGR